MNLSDAIHVNAEDQMALTEFERGVAAARSGQPLPAGATGAFGSGWKMADVERRVIAGEVIAVCGAGTRCAKCKKVAYGHRLGCGCWPTGPEHNPFTEAGLERIRADGYVIEWGVLVLQVKDGRRSMVFMSRDELLLAAGNGMPLVHDFTGEPVDLGS